ncbi:hypothetical protein [Halalkalibacter oceani]|uniref:hypothetical protein n=1 Tax=Halalkalibacter oceani TaxID=1653776 RepID=UPI003398889D
MLTVKKEYGQYLVSGEGIQAVISYFEGSDSSVKGKGARKHKTEIIEAVSLFLQKEHEAAFNAKEAERKQKRDSFLQSATYKNIDLLSLYKVEFYYYDEYHSHWIEYYSYLTGCELLNDNRVIKAELAEFNNTDIFAIGSHGDFKRKELIDNRIFIASNIPYVTGLALKEMLLNGFKTYGNVRLVKDVELRSIQQYGQSDRTAMILFDTTSIKDQLSMKERYNIEMERARETVDEPRQKELYTKEGKRIAFAWFASKPCSMKEVISKELATYDRYVVEESISVDKESFDLFLSNLDMQTLNTEFKGGTNSTFEVNEDIENMWELSEEDQTRWANESYRVVLEVINTETNETLLIDPQGYDYARYIAVKEGFEPTPDNNQYKNNKNSREGNFDPLIDEETTNNSEEVKEQTNAATYYLNEEKNGIEVSFSDKPSEEIRAQLKAHGFRWSRARKIWYAKQSEERLEFVQTLCNNTQPEAHNSESGTSLNFPDIEIDDIETYTIDQQLQDREHDSAWVFRKQKRDHTKEIQETFSRYTNQVKEVISTTSNKATIYYLKRDLQRFKKKYYDAYVKYLSFKANNPSWFVTGAAGRNRHKDRKADDRQHKLMGDLVHLTEEIENKINKTEYRIINEKDSKLKQEIKNTEIDIEFQTKRKEIEYMGIKDDRRVYIHGNYWICKLWGCFRVFKNGYEIHSTKTTEKLEDAKKFVALQVKKEMQPA